MKLIGVFFVVGFALLSTGCFPSFVDNPPLRTISGRVIREDTGAPVANARIAFLSGRQRGFSLLPWDTFGIDATASTNSEGRFTLVEKLNGKVYVTVQNEEFFEGFDLPPFPESNHLENLVWKLRSKRPNQALQHNDPICHESCLRTPRASWGRG